MSTRLEERLADWDRKPKNGTHFTSEDLPPKRGSINRDPSRTRQSEAKEADINTIVKQYDRTGVLPQVEREALFTDVSEMPDYRTSLDFIRRANDLFMDLPADIRTKFDNDAAVFLDWTSDADNRDEMVELGMLPKPDVVEAPLVPVVAPAVEPAIGEPPPAAASQ